MDKVLLYPAYFPCILQMVAIVQAGSVVFELEDNFQKQTYRNRAYIAHSNGKLLLNTPIAKNKTNSSQRKTKDIITSGDMPWQQHHYKSIVSAYKSSPFFEFYIDDLDTLFTKPVKSLQEHNLELFKILCEVLDLNVDISFTTTYTDSFDGLDLRELIDAKKEVKHIFTPYTQVFIESNGFIPNLSILDLLFNLGPACLSYLKEEKVNFN